MKALLLAAGLGTRLHPITYDLPKCLVPIHGVPLLEHWIRMLTNAGLGPLLVNLHHFPDKVQEVIDANPYRHNIVTSYEQNLLGTAGTVRNLCSILQDSAFMLIHADNLSSFNIKAFIEHHNKRPANCEITMMTFVTDKPRSCGIVETNADGVVCSFHEKVENPPGNLANGAVYILEPSVLAFLDTFDKSIIDFSTEVLPNFLNRIFTFQNLDYHRDIGTIDQYNLALCEFSKERITSCAESAE